MILSGLLFSFYIPNNVLVVNFNLSLEWSNSLKKTPKYIWFYDIKRTCIPLTTIHDRLHDVFILKIINFAVPCSYWILIKWKVWSFYSKWCYILYKGQRKMNCWVMNADLNTAKDLNECGIMLLISNQILSNKQLKWKIWI